MVCEHLDHILAWTKLRITNGALEAMNNKVKLVSRRRYGFRNDDRHIDAIDHNCGAVPLPGRYGGQNPGALSGEEPHLPPCRVLPVHLGTLLEILMSLAGHKVLLNFAMAPDAFRSPDWPESRLS